MRIICEKSDTSFFVEAGDFVTQIFSEDTNRILAEYVIENDGMYSAEDTKLRHYGPLAKPDENGVYNFSYAVLVKKTPEKPVLITDII